MERKKGTLWTWDITATEPTVGTARESDPLTTQACMRPTSPAPDRGSHDPRTMRIKPGLGRVGSGSAGLTDGGEHMGRTERGMTVRRYNQVVVCTTIYY